MCAFPRPAATLVLLVAIAVQANAQTQLPTIVVTTPSPVASPPKAASAPAAPQTSVTSAAKVAPKAKTAQPSSQPATAPLLQSAVVEPLAPPPGTLVVVSDAFTPVTVATDREIVANSGSTIADTLQTKPGIAGATFAPGANRPVIRGLDTYRVRTQENGIGTHDVAALSEDHAVPIDPSAADQVEVVRGPATLRYGSQAIGGVVSVITSRIPEALPRNGVDAEVKGGVSSADRGRDGGFKVTAGAGNVVVHADAFGRQAGDYATPHGRQANTFVDSNGFSLGTSLVGRDGFIGVAFTRFNSLYGIPGVEAAASRSRINLGQDKVTTKGEWRVRGFGIEAIRYWFGASDYAHNELVFDGDVGSRFTNKEQEGRIEFQHLPVGTMLGELRGAAGVQLGHRKTSGISFEGDSLLEPARTRSQAAFWFEELQVTRRLRLQAAARIEQTRVDGTGLADFSDPLNPILIQTERAFRPVSASGGVLYELLHGVVARATGQYTERAPDAGELFSKGVHEATGTLEIGNPFLSREKSQTFEVGLKKAAGPLRFDMTAFHMRYRGFIFKQVTGIGCGETLDSCGVEDELRQLVFQQRNTVFRGVEIAAQYDVAPIWRGVWGVEGQYDFVDARFADGERVSRIPPHRLGGGLFYRDGAWLARVNVLHAFEQDKIGLNETPTSGYILLNAEISTRIKLDNSSKLTPELTIGIKGENLLDDDVRNHVSFKKDEVLQPGRNIRLFGTIKLN
jgi:iron complex outermembrane recepter protein